MNLATVLRELGAEDREIEHLAACDKCTVANGYDGAEIFRCPENPISVDSAWIADLNRLGWCLMAAFQIPKRPPGAFERMLSSMVDEYKSEIIRQLNVPLFGGILEVGTLSKA